MTLVNGAAGAGKTLLVADWVVASDPPESVAWLTVESEDNGPGIFWTYVLEAMRHHGLDLPDDVGSPARPGEVDHSLLARVAAHLSASREAVILVLDEFDRVAGSVEIADELQFVLGHAGGGLRLVIISRTEPLLPLHRYRAAGEVTDVRGADLAFLPEETSVLAYRHGMRLSDEGARALTERTGGWAAGLRLCILAAQRADAPEAFFKDFEAGQSTLADFLLAEVLHAQPAETQDLLLRISILDRIHPDLANALTGRADAEPILVGLQRANAFVEAVGHSWYRLHPLFAEILRLHLRLRHPGLEPELHRRAARWLGEAGLLADALSHAADAGDWEMAATRFIDDLAIGQLLTGLEAERLDSLFARMAPDASGPAADLVRAARQLARRDVERGLGYLRRAEESLRDDTHAAASAQLSCALLRVLAARLIGSAELAELAARDAEELERAVSVECLDQHPELTALMLTNLGSAQLWEGRFDAARTALSVAANACDGPATAFPRHEALGRLALIDVLRGWPGRAEVHARGAVAEAERSGLPLASRTGVAQLVLAAVAIERDDLDAAHTHLTQAATTPMAPHDPIVTAGLAILWSRLLLAEGDPRAALEALDGWGGPPTAVRPSPWVTDRIALAASAAHLADGHPDAALEVLREQQAAGPESVLAAARVRLATGDGEKVLDLLGELPPGQGEGPAITVRALLARAQATDVLGDGVRAQRLAAEALFMARPEQLRRPFLESGPWLKQLLHRRPGLTRGHDWLPVDLMGHAANSHASEPVLLLEPLSEREHEVLEQLAQMMSTEEIAVDLFLSVNTVKSHLKSIYRKLAVTRRGEAVRRAREAGLL
ncbi:LuxR C-terminal-related transcriptional regulator [Streptomyces sp. NPDC059161]|uniref:LuxR C-terminal-related transcriptional regulator n=1 Tax=Streptomyces sp. NPDC059161 TaxID=3346749 RepID=UPI0036859F93